MKRSNESPRPSRGPDGGDAPGLRRREVLGYATAAPLSTSIPLRAASPDK